MGLVGMFIIEPNRSENNFRHLVQGAGRIEDLSKATLAEGYEREYSLVYIDVDERLNRISAASNDPQEIEKILHGEHDPTERQPKIFLLNGRSFPFTLRDTPIEVAREERVKLRILNARSRAIKLHTHGFNPMLTHVDGHQASARARVAQDMFMISAGQHIELELRPGSNDLFASGPGVWLMHDHTEQPITNKGINPGGSITTIVYDEFMGENGLPQVRLSSERWLDPAREGGQTALPRGTILETHRMVAKSCERPRGFRRVFMKGGTKLANTGEAYAFEPRTIHAEACEEVEVVFENSDAVRHAMMMPGLNPMFMLAFTGPDTRSARFVTPDEDITLEFHCHVEIHEKMGMRGTLVVGKGGAPEAHDELPASAGHLHEGVGVIVAVQPRKSHLVVDHEEIKNFMAAMIMGYPVKPARLLRGLEAGDRIRFAIDADQQVIVKISPLSFRGEGTVISVDGRKGQIVIDQKEIPGFMAAMIMGYPVKSPKLLMDLTAGDQIGFTIDAEQQAIVEITSRKE
jgi:Cu/Ag efflux protein CusF